MVVIVFLIVAHSFVNALLLFRTMESAEAMIIHNKYDEMMQLISK